MKSEQSNRGFYNEDSSSYDQKRWKSRAGIHTNAVQQNILHDLCTAWRKKRSQPSCSEGSIISWFPEEPSNVRFVPL